MSYGNRSDEFWEIAISVNAAFKGLLGSMGQSGHICRSTVPVAAHLDVEQGWPATATAISTTLQGKVRAGDVVVVADKPIAAALRRIGPRAVLHEPDPKTIDRRELPALAAAWQQRLGFEVSELHMLLADEYGADQSTLGTDDPNLRAGELAGFISERAGVVVDVVISDTDTGLDVRRPLIGTLTIGATPIGATAGVNLYEAMRCAVAAEFQRGHDKGVPIVICKPADRRRRRDRQGQPRHYSGLLDAAREEGISHA